MKDIGYNTIVFDVDSTLVSIEGLDEIARQKGVLSEVASITAAGMRGEMSFQESLETRLAIVRPTKEDLLWLGDQYVQHIVPGAVDLIADLNSLDIQTYIVSGGYTIAINVLARALGIPVNHSCGIDLKFHENGEYAGVNVDQVIIKDKGKLRKIEQLDLTRSIAMVGDGATDLETKEYVDLFVGYGGVSERELVKKNADIYITNLHDMVELISS